MACRTTYQIQSGDTLFLIARKTGLSAVELLLRNPGLDPENLEIGGEICLDALAPEGPIEHPIREGTCGCAMGETIYAVREGDTLTSIAEGFGITLVELLSVNPKVDPNQLQPNQIICIPARPENWPECPTFNYYVVRRNDTFFTIGKIFNVSAEEIALANPTVNPKQLQIGQVLCIPNAPSPVAIVIHLNERMMDVFRNETLYRQYPIGIGKPETPTPTGRFTIMNKQIDPGGAYGTRWMGLSRKGYGIHGNNDPSSIGQAVSNGCIRMYNRDVEELFDFTPTGTFVQILP